VSTTAGDIEVQIPTLRVGSFFPSLLERRRRIDRALHAVIMEAYVHGVSTRSVDDLVAAMGVDSGVSKSEVSRICAGLDKEIDAFRTRSLTHTQFPYVFCDATFCKVRVGAHVVSAAIVVATGVSIDGTREVLGTAVGDSESFEFWREFLASLRGRGLSGVHLVISDAHAGLKSAVAQQFTGSSWQRCRVHFMRNLHTAVSAKHAPAVTAAVKTIFAHTDPEEVATQWDRVADTLAASFPKVAALMGEAKTDVLAFTAFPKAHWQKFGRTTPSSGSTRRSSVALMSRRSSPTRPRSCGWPPPWSSRRTTNGRSPAATSPMSPWPNSGPSSLRNTPRKRLPNNTKSPSVQHDSLITAREPRQIRSPPTRGTLSFARTPSRYPLAISLATAITKGRRSSRTTHPKTTPDPCWVPLAASCTGRHRLEHRVQRSAVSSSRHLVFRRYENSRPVAAGPGHPMPTASKAQIPTRPEDLAL
jgi:transposase-like protein